MEDRILTRIATENASVADACIGICVPSTFYRHLSDNAALCNKYTRARQARADSRFEEVDDVKRKLVAGDIDHNQARVLIDAIKWQCGKEKPLVYGERVAVDQTVNGKLEVSDGTAKRALEDRINRATAGSKAAGNSRVN